MRKSRTQRRATRRLAVERIESRLMLAGDTLGPVINSDVYNLDGDGDYAMIADDSSLIIAPTSGPALYTNGAGYTISREPGVFTDYIGGQLSGGAQTNGHGTTLAGLLESEWAAWADRESSLARKTFLTDQPGGNVLIVPVADNGFGLELFQIDDHGDATGSLSQLVRGLNGAFELRLGAGNIDSFATSVFTVGVDALGNFRESSWATYEARFNGTSASGLIGAAWFNSSLDLNSQTTWTGLTELQSTGDVLILGGQLDGGSASGIGASDQAAAVADAIGQPVALNLADVDAATIGQVRAEAVAASEGGMIAVGRVMAELRGETSVVQVAGYGGAKPQAAELGAAAVSGELARAVAFEVMEGASDDVAEFPVAFVGPGSTRAVSPYRTSAGMAAYEAGASDTASRAELAHDAAGQMHLAAYVVSGGVGVAGGSLEMPIDSLMTDWAGDGAAFDGNGAVGRKGAVDEARGEVFAVWDSGEGAESQFADLRARAISWESAGALAALAVGHVAMNKRSRRERAEKRSN